MGSNYVDITPEERALIAQILKKLLPFESQVWVFGSRAKLGQAKKFSDLDLAIVCGQTPMDLGLLADLREAFDESALAFKVDLVDLNQVGEEFLAIISKDKVKFDEQ